MKKEFSFLSSDNATRIHAMCWKPENEVKAVLQICHGMMEYIERYQAFAEYLCERGFYVVGHDHLGHGQSVQSKEHYGFFHETKGNECVIGDIHKVRRMTAKEYPDVPYYMLGHSMGSFLLRQYLSMYGEGLAGAIIMGTGDIPAPLLTAGKAACRSLAAVKGWKHRSAFVNNMGLGGYNKKFEPSESTKDWVTSDDEIRAAYEKDPLCSFVFTVNGYYHMFRGMEVLTKKETMEKIPKDLPVLFISGGQDPVGEFGKSVARIYKKYKENGMQDVDLKIYPEDRHEVLNERNRAEVYEFLYEWLTKYF